jgi:hypothetical protein
MARSSGSAAAVPQLSALLVGTGAKVVNAYPPVNNWPGFVFAQWQLRDTQGIPASLYIGATTQAKKLLDWRGELAYEGAGYQVLSRDVSTITFRRGLRGSISVVTVRHLGDRQILIYAVVGPDGIHAHSSDDVLRAAWDTVTGGSSTYYVVRVSLSSSISQRSRDGIVRGLLSPVISSLWSDARASGLGSHGRNRGE